jgi:UDPglucose 6-dehydrogenase
MASLVSDAVVVFVSVPTPMGDDGSADVGAFLETLDEFVAAGGVTDGPVICVKSAVPPDVIYGVLESYPGLRLVVSPEFLRERTPVQDMLGMRSLVLGGEPTDCSIVEDLFRNWSNITGPMRTSPGLDATAAALLKYQENAFLAMKVSFMNEFYDVFRAVHTDASWEDLQTAFHMDHERMGTSHWQVPGPDGMRGWGGRCLPKDVSAIRKMADRLGVSTPLLDAMWERNERDRKPTDT